MGRRSQAARRRSQAQDPDLWRLARLQHELTCTVHGFQPDEGMSGWIRRAGRLRTGQAELRSVGARARGSAVLGGGLRGTRADGPRGTVFGCRAAVAQALSRPLGWLRYRAVLQQLLQA